MTEYRKLNNITGWIVFAIATLVYVFTMEASASFWDCGEFISAAYKLQVVHPPGAPIFLMVGRVFSLFAGGNVENVAIMLNLFSALSSSFAILFLFWTTTYFSKKILVKSDEDLTKGNMYAIMGSGMVGALCGAFMTSLWFSAVEAEVYALATFFYALVFWAMTKWDNDHAHKYSDRWLLFIAMMLGLSGGVHLLSLLAIPAVTFMYYFRKYETSTKGVLITLGITIAILGGILYGLLDKLIAIAADLDLLFVNDFGMPFYSGIILFSAVFLGALTYGIVWSTRTGNRPLNTTLLSFTFLLLGFFSYEMVLIRANAQPPINMNGIDDVHDFLSYLKREQYGTRDLISGHYFTSIPIFAEDGDNRYSRGEEKYEVIGNKGELIYDLPDAQWNMLAQRGQYTPQEVELIRKRNGKAFFPRMGSTEDRHVRLYYKFLGINTEQERAMYVPNFADNMKYFFNYQIGYMFWRYFMWNVSGRQNDEQGYMSENYKNGNWITGIPMIDEVKHPQLTNLSSAAKNDMTRSVYYMLPFILGILGIIFQLKTDKKGFWVIFLLFFFMGVMNLVNSNQPPVEPRERDYALVGSVYAFAIWIGLGLSALYSFMQNFEQKKLTEYLLYGAVTMSVLFLTGLTQYEPTGFIYATVYVLFVILALLLMALGISKVVKSDGARAIVLSVILLGVPALMGFENMDNHDRSDRTFARDFARNYLESCAPNAILFTQGDNDTYPLWFAQEVEGIRTDVRIVNLSLLGVDWYINMLRRKMNDAAPVKLLLSEEQVLGDKRNVVRYDKEKAGKNADQRMDLLGTLKRYVQQNNDPFLPTKKFSIPVDRSKVLANGIVPESQADNIIDRINFDLKKGTLYKNDLMVLDIVASNQWDRPIYFAITVTPDSYLGLEKYFQHDAMAYRFIPIEVNGKAMNKGMDTEVAFELLMDKDRFSFGGLEKGKRVYMEPSARGSAMTQKYFNYQNLANELANEGQRLVNQGKTLALSDSTDMEIQSRADEMMAAGERKKGMALQVIDRMMEVFPESSLPFDYTMINVANLYQELGAPDKARPIVKSLADFCMDELDYLYTLFNKDDNLRQMYLEDVRTATTCMQGTIEISESLGDVEYAAELKQQFDAIRQEYNIPIQ